MNTQQIRKTMVLGGCTYHLPFRTNGHWLEDARGHNVGEMYSEQVALATAIILNEQGNAEWHAKNPTK
jgi:hypothetical protein